jgi:hypothetical protein
MNHDYIQERSSPTVDMKLKRIRHLLLAKVALLALWGCVSGCSPAANPNFIVPTVPATVQNSPPSILQSGGSSPSESRVVTQADSYTPCRLAAGRATSDTSKTEVDAFL